MMDRITIASHLFDRIGAQLATIINHLFSSFVVHELDIDRLI